MILGWMILIFVLSVAWSRMKSKERKARGVE